MEKKYINAGIVKEMTLYLNGSGTFNDAFNKIGEYVNLNLYDMKVYNNSIYLELDKEYIKNHLISFLEEVDSLKLPTFIDYSKKIEYIKNHLDDDLDHILEYCDDLFKERFRSFDTFSINDDSYHLDIICYVFYFEGPYNSGNFDSLLKYMHILQKKSLKNPLSEVLCFGLSS